MKTSVGNSPYHKVIWRLILFKPCHVTYDITCPFIASISPGSTDHTINNITIASKE
ncbi:hypothetical protein Bca52824_082404 [Brassica carinata]|uniref:Uncharacterized protein n=1 Tax=Brassica carinata TaxID=52824 RepID=A0A8X7PJV3_BRACI|nr:hypothetical protein Bca52824_082404 [Brassica carinata]